MKLKPRPAFDPESAPMRPWIRGWVQFSAVVMVLQCLANIVLFRVHAFDITFSGLVMVTAGLCFGAWRWRELRFLAGFWIMLSLLGWVGVAFLSYYSALAIHAERTAPPVPEHLVRKPPPPEDVAAFEEMMRRFPPTVEDGADAELLEALKFLGDLRSRVKSEDSPPSWEEVFAEPETEAAIARAKPYLAEYFAFMEVHQPTLTEYTYGSSVAHIAHFGDCAKAGLEICRQLAFQQETANESWASVERLLRSVACQLEGEKSMIGFVVMSGICMNIVWFIEGAPPLTS